MKSILIVDDSEVNLFLIQTIFHDDPAIHVIIESDSTKALSRLREGHPDVLVLDLMMPHIDGFQILEQIKTYPDISNIPVLIVSAYHDVETMHKAMSYHVADFIKKPISLTEVEEKIRGVLNHRQNKTTIPR